MSSANVRRSVVYSCVGLSFLLCALTGCVRSAYLNDIEPYSKYIGEKYVLLQDCYIFKIDYPRPELGAYSPSQGITFLPKTVDSQYVGHTYYKTIKILGIARKGSVFTIQSIREDTEPTIKRISIEARMQNGLEVDIHTMLNRNVGPESRDWIPSYFAVAERAERGR